LEPVWTNWLKYGGDWLLIPIYEENGFAVIRRWSQDGRLEILAKASPREGLAYISAYAINSRGRLAMRGWLKPSIFFLDIHNPKAGFKRGEPAIHLFGSLIYWNDDLLVGGTQDLRLKLFSEGALPLLKTLNRRLPDASHPSQYKVNHHRMLLAKRQNILAVGYALYNEIALADTRTQKVRTVLIGFPGYIEPLKRYPKNMDPNRDNEYMGRFHHLTRLAWHKGALYGMFRKGYEGYGVWASLSPKGLFKWDNNSRREKVLAISENEVVMGSVERSDKPEETVTWRLWRSSSLPSG